jgi:hypothetical protein
MVLERDNPAGPPAIVTIGYSQRYERYEPKNADEQPEKLLVTSGRPTQMPAKRYTWDADRYIEAAPAVPVETPEQPPEAPKDL